MAWFIGVELFKLSWNKSYGRASTVMEWHIVTTRFEQNDSEQKSNPVNKEQNSANYDFDSSFGESLDEVLNLDNWGTAHDLLGLYDKLAREIAIAVELETSVRAQIRNTVFPQLKKRQGAPLEAGVFQATNH